MHARPTVAAGVIFDMLDFCSIFCNDTMMLLIWNARLPCLHYLCQAARLLQRSAFQEYHFRPHQHFAHFSRAFSTVPLRRKNISFYGLLPAILLLDARHPLLLPLVRLFLTPPLLNLFFFCRMAVKVFIIQFFGCLASKDISIYF